MKTVFFLQSSHCQSNRAELAGAKTACVFSAQALHKALLKATGKTPVAWRKQHLR